MFIFKIEFDKLQGKKLIQIDETLLSLINFELKSSFLISHEGFEHSFLDPFKKGGTTKGGTASKSEIKGGTGGTRPYTVPP